MKYHFFSAHGLQLRDCIEASPGFAEALFAAIGDLVAADDQRVGELADHRFRFAGRKALGSAGGCFAGERGFVRGWRGDLEGQLQARQQLAPKNRGGCEDQPRFSWVRRVGQGVHEVGAGCAYFD